MEFKLIDGKIHLKVYEKWIDITDQVMPVVDDYLDHALGLVGKHEMKRKEVTPLTDVEKMKLNEEYHRKSGWR